MGRSDWLSGRCGHSCVTGRKRLQSGLQMGGWPDTLRADLAFLNIFFFFKLRENWHITFYSFQVYHMEMFFLVMRTFESYSLSNLQIYRYRGLLTTVIIPGLIILYLEVCTFDHLHPILPCTPPLVTTDLISFPVSFAVDLTCEVI